MRAKGYLVGIPLALVTGLLIGRALFPPRIAVATDGAQNLAARQTVSALPRSSGGGRSSNAVLQTLVAGRASVNPVRTEFSAIQRVRAMKESEIVALAERLSSGDVRVTQYQRGFIEEVWKRYATIDPQAAYDGASKLLTVSQREVAWKFAARPLAKVDPQGAFANFVAEGEARNWDLGFETWRIALDELVAKDPALGIAAIEAHRQRGGSWMSMMEESLFKSWWSRDAPAARSWLMGEAADDPYQVRLALRKLSDLDPSGALEMALAHQPTEGMRSTVAQIIGRNMCRKDRVAAAAVVRALPEAWLSTQLAKLFGQRGVRGLPADQIADYATMFPNEPLRAEFWTGVIGDHNGDVTNTEATLERAKAWAEIDPEPARRWAEAIGDLESL